MKQINKKNQNSINNSMIQLEIPSSSYGSTLFEPQTELSDQTTPKHNPTIPNSPSLYSPEKKLTLFALRLAIIEKTATGLGQLAFVWATVVLLGGFASDLSPKDFWFVTAILLVEAARLFSRSRELEWQHQSTRSLPPPPSRRRTISRSATRPHDSPNLNLNWKWLPADVPLLPHSNWIFLSKNISQFLYWLQIIAAAACIALSLLRLGQQDYGKDAKINEESALNVFYSLALAEALMFLLEKGYWTWRIEHGKLLVRVSEDCDFGPIGVISLRRFFYDAYSRCIDGSIFDGLKMDLISFAEELLDSDSSDEQIIGASILQKFIENDRFAGETIRKIGSSVQVIERLIEMLTWKDPGEENIRRSASEILSRLASRKMHALRVAAIPGAIESIASLLQSGQGKPYEEYEFSAFNLIGLLILKRLARDHDNCWKIGNARGLLARIIDLTNVRGDLLIDERATEEARIKTVRRALQVVRILVRATGQTGKLLRRNVSEIVYLVSNIRELLEYGERHMKLQMIGLEILTSLGMDEEAREKIGATGNMIMLIFVVFLRPIVTEEVGEVCNEAGEALGMLIFESEGNCERMFREEDDVVRRLIGGFGDPELRVNAARILRGLCAYSAKDRFERVQIVAEAMPMVLKTIMEEKEKEKLVEVSIGLAIQILKFKGIKFGHEIERVGIKEEDFVGKLVEILRRYENPVSKVPRMRRFVIELTITLMNYEKKYIKLFKVLGMEKVLLRTAETTSELECFNVFSGSVGLGRHEVMISSLVDTAIEILVRDSNSG